MLKTKRNKIILITLSLIVILGAFLRFYKHQDLLHFELDQARDAIVVKEALMNGPGELPLQGPRAAGTRLRLGPAFYYLQYLSALIFGHDPAGMNTLFVVFAISSIVLIYFLFKIYFSPKISLLIAAVFSVSLFLVTYSRFAWNPNALPFFLLVFFLSLLKITQNFFLKNKTKETKAKNDFWHFLPIYGLAVSFAIITQLHFLIFLALPIILIGYLIWFFCLTDLIILIKKKKRFNLKVLKLFLKLKIKKFKTKTKTKTKTKAEQIKTAKTNKLTQKPKFHFIVAILIVFLFHFPVLINEVLTGFDNFKEFKKAVTEKSEDSEDHNLLEKGLRNIQEYSTGYFIVLTGLEKTDTVKNDFLENGQLIDFSCDKMCRKRLPYSLTAFVVFALGLFLFVKAIYHEIRYQKIKNNFKLHFLMLNLIFFSVVFFGFISVAYDFPPRFLLTTIIMPFLLLGFILEFFAKINAYLIKNNFIFSNLLVLVTVAVLIVINLQLIQQRLDSQIKAHTDDSVKVDRDLILKEPIRFTYKQQKLIIDWMLENSNKETIYIWAPPRYYRPFLYHLIYNQNKDGERQRYDVECLNADFFAATKTKSDNDFFDKGSENFESVKQQRFGTLIIHQLKIKDESKAQSIECIEEENKEGSYARRYNWNEVIPELLEDWRK
jgi:4-amino-4-deoxy-L-arabinose transferase-like glycosyltransferase